MTDSPPHLDLPFAAEHVTGAIAPVDALQDRLAPAELAAIANAVTKRQREFRAGRTLARRLLRRLGESDPVLPSSAERHVLWPDGLTGSISHSKDWAAAAVARRSQVGAVGLDIEREHGVADHLRSRVLLKDEAQGCARHADDDATVYFSCKEAVYKAVHPHCGEFLDFPDVQIELGAKRFRARCLKPGVSARLIELGAGQWGVQNGIIVALFTISPASLSA
ncbi:MAG: 4'-phosphopantetheinyl transferase superfamily protein [Pseudomonadota bacterium]